MTEFHDEFGELPLEGLDTSRRSFLRLAGFGLAASALGACSRGEARKVIPYLVPAEQIVPGRAYWMATTCGGCSAGCGVLAKGRDGRPVKLEGIPEHPLSQGGLCAAGQGSLLGLYDSLRLDGAARDGQPVEWPAADVALIEKLEAARRGGGKVRLLSGTITSPSTLAAIAAFLGRFADGKHVVYDADSASALLDAHQKTHDLRALPWMRFDRAKVIVSFGADFLGTWISPVEFSAGWREQRQPEAQLPRMSRHWQFENRVSLTGTVADERVPLAPWETGPALAALCSLLGGARGVATPFQVSRDAAPAPDAILAAASDLWNHQGESLVVCASSDPQVQVLVNLANELLGNYGETLDLARPSRQKQGDERALLELRNEMDAGSVEVLVVARANPAYDLPGPESFAAGMEKCGTVASLAGHRDETAARAAFVLPEPHYLEAWDDAEPLQGLFGLRQPVVTPLRSTRSLRATLRRWMGDEREDRELLREHWQNAVHPLVDSGDDFETFFNAALERGFVEAPAPRRPAPAFRMSAVTPVAWEAFPPDALGVVLYTKAGVRDGSHAENPWLQELPDPVSKVAWDNYAALAPATAREMDIRSGDVVRVSTAGGELELPAHIQPGQHERVVAVALGYGRAGTARFANIAPEWIQGEPTVEPGGVVGANAAPLAEPRSGWIRTAGIPVTIEKTGRRRELAVSQGWNTEEVPPHLAPRRGKVRHAVLATTWAAWQADPAYALKKHAAHEAELWPDDFPMQGARWGMAVDLSACTGCSACVISCQAENNVPVVGRDEVRRHREMHWIRIDRYYDPGSGAADGHAHHQPMMCQHCDHAPCETVCPVLATVHSSEGLNQQVYNRCVGTRYCANNCPYKVRRFNWFDYPREDRLQNMVLNPDVTVRSRGVMEKCSLCAQRIMEARIEARRRGEKVQEGDIQTACQQSCPTAAIVFGDLNDPQSRVSRLAAGQRSYRVLEELNVQPSVHYLAAIRNRAGGAEEGPHG